jgi:hypothetical protein
MLASHPVRGNRSVVYVVGEPQGYTLTPPAVNIPSRVRIVGFLFGFSLASSFAAYRLLDEYKQASVTLQASVEELQQSTEKVGQCLAPKEHLLHPNRSLRMFGV